MPKASSNGNLALVNGAVVWAIEAAGALSGAGEKLLFAAGYPITPVNEVTEYLSRVSKEVNAAFVQAESEIAAANMVLGAASVGIPALTVTSSPGISLMQEAISYAAGMELGGRGLVYVDVARGDEGVVGCAEFNDFTGSPGFEITFRYEDGSAVLIDKWIGNSQGVPVVMDFLSRLGGADADRYSGLPGISNRDCGLGCIICIVIDQRPVEIRENHCSHVSHIVGLMR